MSDSILFSRRHIEARFASFGVVVKLPDNGLSPDTPCFVFTPDDSGKVSVTIPGKFRLQIESLKKDIEP